jgi:hypothetical protein
MDVMGTPQEPQSPDPPSQGAESLDELLAAQLKLLWSIDLGDTPVAVQFEASSSSA